MKIEFRIHNYRCFSFEQPATFVIGNGETAFVGPNNAGKSTILKFFIEFRQLFQLLGEDLQVLTFALKGISHGLGVLEYTTHHANMFNNSNSENISIFVKCDLVSHVSQGGTLPYDPQKHVLPKALQIEINREGQWTARLLDGSDNPIRFQEVLLGDNNSPAEVRNTSPDTLYYFEHFSDAFLKIAKAMYVGPFRGLLEGGSGSYFDMTTGADLVRWWDNMRNGHDPNSEKKINKIEDVLSKLFGYRNLTIDTNHQNTAFYLRIDRQRHMLAHMGSGFSQFLILLANLAIKQPSFVIIDEPELHLHPSLQIEFVSVLRTLASDGVIFATHNIGLARSVANQLYSVRRRHDISEVRLWEKTGKLGELAGEMGFSAYQDLGYETILLVEGATEIKTVQQILRLFDKDHRVVLVPLGGSSLINGKRDEELLELKRLSEEVYAMVDSERTAADAPPASDRHAFQESCMRVGIDCHVTKLRATENYFTDTAVKSYSKNFRAIGPFENLEKVQPPRWGKNENWLIAKEMTKEDWLNTDIGQFLDRI